MPRFSPFSRRQNEVHQFEERVAESSAMLAENGYRGGRPEDVPAEAREPESDGFAHYASQAQLAESRLTGRPVQALCGRVWTPVNETAGMPVCPKCDETFRALPAVPPGGRRRH